MTDAYGITARALSAGLQAYAESAEPRYPLLYADEARHGYENAERCGLATIAEARRLESQWGSDRTLEIDFDDDGNPLLVLVKAWRSE